MPVSELYEVLHPLDVEGLLYLMARHGHEHNIGQDVTLFLTRLKDVRVDITGDDLLKMGEIPGPLYGEVLRYVLAAKLDGKAFTREEQLALAARYMELHKTDPDGRVGPFPPPHIPPDGEFD